MYLVDLETAWEASHIIINNWVCTKTEQRIKDLLPQGSIDTLTRLVLTNAIYFKANWLYPFNVASTTTGTFTLLDNSTVSKSLMRQVVTTTYYEAANQFQAIKLPYQGTKKNSMIIILTAAGQFQSFDNSFTIDQYNTIKEGLSRYEVTLTLPKFSYE